MTGVQAAAPGDLAALSAVMARAKGPLNFIAGGTDMLVMPRQAPRDGWIVDISRTIGLFEISLDGDTLRVGATATLADLARNGLVRAHFPVLAQAADQCGSAQIRNRATIGGNVANASPAGDLLPLLKCAGAAFHLLSPDGGTRRLLFNDLVKGAGKTDLAPGELITRIDIPLGRRLPRFAFAKLGRRDDLTISRLNLAMEADFDSGRRDFGEVRLVAGAIAPTPLTLPAVAATLSGTELNEATVNAFLAALLAAVDRAIPGRASQPYKRRAIAGLGLDLLEKITGIAGLVP